MKVINKKVIVIILMLLEVTSLFLCYKSFNNKNTVLDDVILKESNEVKNKGFAIMVQNSNGEYVSYNSKKWPSDMIYNEEKSGCIDIKSNKLENALSFDSVNNMVTVETGSTAYCYLYFDMDKSGIYYKLVDDYANNNGVSLLSETSSDTYPVYYYTGDITNNNIMYADYCWKMVRTTDTGGVKLIYNGEAYYSQYENLEESKYSVSTNTPSGTPFTFDSSTKKWTSGIAGVDSTTNTIEFTVTSAGDYVLAYDVSSEANWDKASFYKNGTALKSDVSGTASGQIDLDGLTTSDVIKVTYTKDSSSASGSDTVSFSIGTPVGEKTKSCNNTRTATYIETSGTAFNNSYNSPAYVGYMYNKVYTRSSKSLSSDTTSYVYGNSVSWDGSSYTLNSTTSGTWSSKYSSLSNNHYTCFSTSTTCTSVYYIYYGSSSQAYYITLTNGKTVEDALNEMLYNEDVNTTNSTIKTKIDSWYESNIKEKTDSNNKLYSSYLENAIYCYNRAMSNESTNGWNPNGGSLSTYMNFNYSALNCEKVTDQFTLKESVGGTAGYGNNALDYPIGLLTYKEVDLARNGSSTNYLNNNSYYWLGSPVRFDDGYAVGWRVGSGGLGYSYVDGTNGVRPVVSLSSMVKIKDGTGDGSVTSPYEVILP